MTDKNQKPENPPAFPWQWISPNSIGEEVVREQGFGITIWDFYAAHALASLNNFPNYGEEHPDVPCHERVTRSATIADLLLAERAKRGIK